MAETQKEFNFKIHGKTYKPAILDNDTLYVPDKNINPALKPEEATYSDIDNAFPSDYFFSELIKGELDTLDDLNVIENPNYMDTYFIKSEGRYYRCDEDGYFYPWVKTLDGLTENDIIHALGYAPLSEADMNVIYDEIDNIFNSELPDVIKGSKASMSALNSLTDSVPGDIWFVVSEGKYYKFSIDGNWSEWSTVRSAITKEDLGLGNVENKSSETIRNEITSDDVVHALGFKPLTDEVNFDFESIRNELAGKVGKSGNKVLTDNNLSDELKGKYDDAVNKAHTHSNKNILDRTTESFTTEKNNKINTNETNISTLAKHMTGDLTDSDFQEDSTVAMTKTVPSGMGDYAAIKVIGGKTVKDEENQVLKNAVVESVVSCGVNLWDEKWESGAYSDSTGLPISNNTVFRSKNFIEIKPITKYTINKQVRICFYDESKTFISTYAGYVTNYVSPTNAKYMAFNILNSYGSETYKNDIIVSETSKPYSPYYKTTLLIPDSIKNLPDYGVEGNVVDFENGTYTHTNTITDGAITALSTAETINISDILHPIRIEAGGTLTFTNEHNLDVPNTIVYKKEVSLS